MIGEWPLRRPIGGALHSPLFARTCVAAWDRGRYYVRKDATPGGGVVRRLGVEGRNLLLSIPERVGILKPGHARKPRTNQGVASFQT